MRVNCLRNLGAQAARGHLVRSFAAVLMICGLGGTYVACASREMFVSAWQFKPCDPSNTDLDCIELAGTHCDIDLEMTAAPQAAWPNAPTGTDAISTAIA